MNVREQWLRSAAGQWYAGLDERDRRVVQGVAALVVAALLWVLVVAPVLDWRATAESRWQGNSALLADVQARAPQLRGRAAAAGRGGQVRDAGQLMTLVANSSRAFGLTLARFQPESGGGVSVVLQGQEWNGLVRWLDQLGRQQGVDVGQLTVDAADAPGRVDARVVLRP